MARSLQCFNYKLIKLNLQEVLIVLNLAIGFLLIAIVAAVLGFSGIAGASAGIAKIFFIIFLVLFVISLIFGRKGTT